LDDDPSEFYNDAFKILPNKSSLKLGLENEFSGEKCPITKLI